MFIFSTGIICSHYTFVGDGMYDPLGAYVFDVTISIFWKGEMGGVTT